MSEKQLGRRSSAQNMKEKVVKYYECVFQDGDPSAGNRNFWNEFFLLKANIDALESQFSALSTKDLAVVKPNINELFVRCVNCLGESHSISTVNAMQTMCGLVKGAFSKSKGDYSFEVIDLLLGFDEAENIMQRLIDNIHAILESSESAVSLKNMCLRFLLTVVTVTDNVSQNALLEYLMINNIFDSLLLILSEPALRIQHGNDAVLLLMLLVQYRKYEATNPYMVNLSILDNDLVLNGLSQIIAGSLLGYNRQFTDKMNQQKSTGFMSSISNMVGSMFTSDETPKVKVKPDIPLLLALYEAVHLNRNFVLALTTSHASSMGSGTIPTDDDGLPPPAIPRASDVPTATVLEELDQPTNLLATFLEYTSIILHDVKDSVNFNVAKLCFVILTCVAEDQYACSLMHDPNINFSVPIHRLPMRHRKLPPDTTVLHQPLASSALELQVEFIVSHMMKTLPAELYMQSLDIIHRLLVYQKKSRVRLSFPWKQLWAALTNLVKFILANDVALLKTCNIFLILQKVVIIFNMFITYGDTFLASPTSYDELYYELIRTSDIYDNLYTLTIRYSSGDKWRDDSAYLIGILGNIRAVVNHFKPKVESWASVNHLSSLTEEQVLEVVKTNYDTLTLKVHDYLDQFERYSEKPKYTNFFLLMVRALVLNVREKAVIGKLEQASLLKEFSSIPTTPS